MKAFKAGQPVAFTGVAIDNSARDGWLIPMVGHIAVRRVLQKLQTDRAAI
jgi:hypothetical protein